MFLSSFMSSRYAFLSFALLAFGADASFAQSRLYRCGNEYTDKPSASQLPNCKLVDGGNLTVVQSAKPSATASSKVTKPASSAAQGKASEPSAEQKARDSDARLILEDEMAKAEQKLNDLLKEYNNGEPEKLGPEHRNHQKYLDRVAEMKSSIDRAKSDIEGIKRELSRLLGR